MTTMTTDIVAQDLKTGYLSDGFLYRHDINPAIANEEGYFSIPFLGYINADMAGNFGYEDVIKKNPLYPNQSDKKMTSFMNPYLSQQLNGFASGDNIINGRIKEIEQEISDFKFKEIRKSFPQGDVEFYQIQSFIEKRNANDTEKNHQQD